MASSSSPSSAMLQLQAIFPLAVGLVQRQPDPLDLAIQMQAIRRLQAGASSNPDPGCAWTGDLNGVWQLHRHPVFTSLLSELVQDAWNFIEQLGFNRQGVALHLQRCWPVVCNLGQVVGRHHHPNAHISGVYYLNGDGSGRSGCLRFFPSCYSNELVPGLAVGHDGPINASSRGAQLWNAPWHDIAPRTGLLLLFPAGVDHAVLENEDPDDSRYSISFDLVLTSITANDGIVPEYLSPHPSDWQEVKSSRH